MSLRPDHSSRSWADAWSLRTRDREGVAPAWIDSLPASLAHGATQGPASLVGAR